MHGGSVEVSSAGLDRRRSSPCGCRVVRAPAPTPAPLSKLSGEVLRILVVDDNRDGAMAHAKLLQHHGHETYTAHDGVAAVEEAARLRPDVILLDIGLPRLTGDEAARRIRAAETGRRAVMVAITGWGQEKDRRRSKEAGFDAHLVKPVDTVALLKLLAQLGASPRGNLTTD